MSNDPRNPPPTERVTDLVDVVVRLAAGDLEARGAISSQGDELDAAIGGLNMLAEELQITFADVDRRTHELERVNADLTSAQSQLVQSSKLASLGEIAAGIAHELNQPLGIIQLYCEKALSGLADLSPEHLADGVAQASEQISVALGQVRRASDIIEHVRAFSRNETKAELADADVESIVEGGLLLLRRELSELGIMLVEHIEPGLGQLFCQEPRLQQVLFNLVANARDAVVNQLLATVEVNVRSAGTEIVFEVIDNGPGVDDFDMEQIMDPFYTTKKAGQGTGLGLPICQTIAREHGGSVTYERRGERTVFALHLPRRGMER